jgi:hypothetical protein
VSEGDDKMTASIEERRRIIAGRNRALGLTLLACVVLFFAITLVKMKI